MTWLLLVIAAAVLIVSVAVMVRVLLALDAIKAAAEVVAANLATAQRAVDGVAVDLADSHVRADTAEGPHGAAGDAAARSGDTDA